MPDTGWDGKQVMVTGADGFIGGMLAIRLAVLGARVTAVTRDSRPLPEERSIATALGMLEGVEVGDVADDRFVARAFSHCPPEIVFHLAAEALVPVVNRNPLEAVRSNILGTATVLEFARLYGANVVCASSDKALGQQETFPISEAAVPAPKHPYDITKASCELLVKSYAEHYSTFAVGTRLANVYGPGDTNWSRIVPGTMRELICGRTPVLRSDGSPVREYIYIDDAVDAYISIGGNLDKMTPGSLLTISSGVRRSVRQVVDDIREVCARHERVTSLAEIPTGVVIETAVNETQRIELEQGAIGDITGWRARWDWIAGLDQAHAWLTRYLFRASTFSRPRDSRTAAGQ